MSAAERKMLMMVRKILWEIQARSKDDQTIRQANFAWGLVTGILDPEKPEKDGGAE